MNGSKLSDAERVRTARYLDNQKKRGMVQVRVWVPDDKKEAIMEYAKHLRSVK